MSQGSSQGLRQGLRQASRQGMATGITQQAYSALSVSPAAASIAALATTQLSASASVPGGKAEVVTRAVTWTTSDATKATVSATGLVTGVAAGSATITARIQSGTGTLLSSSCAITVT